MPILRFSIGLFPEGPIGNASPRGFQQHSSATAASRVRLSPLKVSKVSLARCPKCGLGGEGALFRCVLTEGDFLRKFNSVTSKYDTVTYAVSVR